MPVQTLAFFTFHSPLCIWLDKTMMHAAEEMDDPGQKATHD
jgi:hypothetical protein